MSLYRSQQTLDLPLVLRFLLDSLLLSSFEYSFYFRVEFLVFSIFFFLPVKTRVKSSVQAR